MEPMRIATEIIMFVLSTMGALIPIVNPFSTAPLLVSLTTTYTPEERLDTVRRACLAAPAARCPRRLTQKGILETDPKNRGVDRDSGRDRE